MTKPTFLLLAGLFLLAFALLFGCGTAQSPVKTPERPAPPKKTPPAAAITVQLAALDLAHHSGRIERADIEKFAAVIRREKIDILAIQGITRYPGVATRVDFVETFGAVAEMRQAFGETANMNGRVGGNAVFSIFPINANTTTHYAEAQGLGFESALQAIVDCGVRDLVIVSTRLPDKTDPAIETDAMTTYTTFWTTYLNRPIILCGNLPHGEVIQPPAAYADGSLRQGDAPRLWYTNDGVLTLHGTRAERTNLGALLITQVAIQQPARP
jgi:hypothetical protein